MKIQITTESSTNTATSCRIGKYQFNVDFGNKVFSRNAIIQKQNQNQAQAQAQFKIYKSIKNGDFNLKHNALVRDTITRLVR